MFSVAEVLGAAHVILNDAVSPYQISDCELFAWLKQEIEQISLMDKSLFSSRRQIFMKPGTCQHIPEDTNSLLSLIYNINEDGDVGKSIQETDVHFYECKYPNWRTEKKKTQVYNYMRADNIRTFEVYPPQKGDKSTSVMALFNVSPSSKLKMNSVIKLPVVYKKALSYLIASCYLMKDTADIENINLGMTYKKIALDTLKSSK